MNIASDKRNMIIEAAENLFHHYGYSKTSLEDIARSVSLGKGTIYYYFASKEDIFFEVVIRHSEKFYEQLKLEIDKQTDFSGKLSTAIRLPIKLVYDHAPILLDAIKNLPENVLHKLCSFRDQNRQKMTDLFREIFYFGYRNGDISSDLPVEKVINIIYDLFMLGDSNIIIKYPEEFIKKAENDYELIVHIMLNGILQKGKTK